MTLFPVKTTDSPWWELFIEIRKITPLDTPNQPLIFYLFIYLFLAALGLLCCTRAFSSCGEQGLLLLAVRGLLTVVLLLRSTGSKHAGFSNCGSQALERRLSSCGAGLSCSAACGIFPDQGSNPCPLHWQADS